ncbi:hypothetical protein [Streptomyces sp. Agncl-13]|uniref:hypothetical protein n=1 Tax=Streptomyces sp. Agncl-13 TaxID=3400628 RepID=UPI003A8C1D5A
MPWAARIAVRAPVPRGGDAERAGRGVTGRSEGDFYDAVDAQRGDDSEPLDPAGERWDASDDAEAERRLPRLSEMFPVL